MSVAVSSTPDTDDPDKLGRGLERNRRPILSRLRQVDWPAYLYLVPFGIVLGIFSVWPLFFGFWISLWKWGIEPIEFIGMDNYTNIFTSGMFDRDLDGRLSVGPIGQSVLNTVYYSVGTVTLTIVLAFLIATMIFRIRWLQSLLKVLFFLPYATTIVATAIVFVWMFDPQLGVANALLRATGMSDQTWLQDPDSVLTKLLHAVGLHMLDGIPAPLMGPSLALTVVILFSVWNSLGLAIMIYLAGLSTIPTEVIEAAELDGATGWRRLRDITVPMLSPTTLFLLVYQTVVSFKAFTPIFALTQGGGSRGAGSQLAGGPLGSTNVLTVEIFNGFYQRTDQVGYAAAVSFLLLSCLVIISVLQFRLLGRRAYYG